MREEWCGIYLHIPFCRSKCPYCDFLSFPGCSSRQMELYCKALIGEMRSRIPLVAEDFSRFTMYIGGGTPTVLPHPLLEELLDTALSLVPSPKEVTVETNPFAVDEDLVSIFQRRGVTRVSVGVQTLSQALLKVLGRGSIRGEALNALDILSKAPFLLSVDLIYGIPSQTREILRNDLEEVLRFNPHHISAYSLTLEGDVPLKRAVETKKCYPPSEEEWEGLFLTVKDTLEKRGYHHYEISNYARDKRYCLHNLIYWSNGNYLGLGLGAVSHLNGRRWSNPVNLESYLKGNLTPAWEEKLPPHKKASETAMLMLRTSWGVPSAHPLFNDNPSLQRRFRELEQDGLLTLKDGYWKIPPHLLVLSNEVLLRVIEEP